MKSRVHWCLILMTVQSFAFLVAGNTQDPLFNEYVSQQKQFKNLSEFYEECNANNSSCNAIRIGCALLLLGSFLVPSEVVNYHTVTWCSVWALRVVIGYFSAMSFTAYSSADTNLQSIESQIYALKQEMNEKRITLFGKGTAKEQRSQSSSL